MVTSSKNITALHSSQALSWAHNTTLHVYKIVNNSVSRPILARVRFTENPPALVSSMRAPAMILSYLLVLSPSGYLEPLPWSLPAPPPMPRLLRVRYLLLRLPNHQVQHLSLRLPNHRVQYLPLRLPNHRVQYLLLQLPNHRVLTPPR